MSVIHYGIANKILKWTRGVYGDIEEPQIKSVSLNVNASDIAFGTEYPVTLCELPESSMLMDASLNITTPFSNTQLGAKLSLGLGTDESDVNTPDDYDYKTLIFNNQDLNTPGLFNSNGYLDFVGSKSLNKNINTLVAYFTVMGVWSSANSLAGTGRLLAGAGTQTAGLRIGGYSTGVLSLCEEYDGTTWGSAGSLNTARAYNRGVGTQTAALSCGGETTVVEEYNGTSWSIGGPLLNSLRDGATGGSQNSAFYAGGWTTAPSNQSQEYNGISWTALNTLNNSTHEFIGCGNISAGLVFGGVTSTSSGNPVDITEEYNGSTWSIANSLITVVLWHGGCGLQNNALKFAGTGGGYSNKTEEYDGASWRTGNNVNTGRYALAGCGTTTSALSFGGWVSAATSICEEYNPGNLASLASAWFLGGNLNTSDQYSSGCGTQDAALKITGLNVGRYCEEYNGSSWSTTADLTPVRAYTAAAGTQTAGVTFGGYWSSNISNTDEYNGSTWSASGNLISAKRMHGGAGTQNAALAIGGYTSTFITGCEEYNGATWAAGGNLNVANRTMGGAGTQNSALSIGGDRAGNYSAVTEEYDGASWSIGGTLNNGRDNNYATGASSLSAITTGGNIAGNSSTSSTEEYDGTSWTQVNNSLKATRSGGTAGIQNKALIFAGSDGSSLTTTQEYNIPSQGDLDLNITFSFI